MFQKFILKFFSLFVIILFVGCSSQIVEKPLKECKRIHGSPGPEDIIIHRPSKKLYISSHNRRNFEETGKIFFIDLNKESKDWKTLPIEGNYPKKFRPHGISLVEKDGKLILYVISHAMEENKKNTIEVFEIIGDKIKHLKTYSDPSLTSPNDLIALPDGRIFVSNDHGTGGKFRNLFDDAFKLKRSKIAFFDNEKWNDLGEGVAFGNGIYYRVEDGKEIIYRAVFMSGTILKYQLVKTEKSYDLKMISEIHIQSGVDNIEPDENGNLYVAAHPSTWKFLQHAKNKENFSPSEVYKISKDLKFTKIYANSGKEISAASTAIPFENKLIISQVFEDFLLVCDLDN
ncbi:MAG: arylesterase [Leptospiraceae bacterium]|nr:arylesterase [Leptospiraceae bacterium]MCK6381462.1 arylesterase [Leptospiraceae bacterium]NUM40177.1 arylesterase [Leptospiraceae bacterium]